MTFPAQWQKVKYFFTHLGKNQAQKIEVPVAIDQSSTDLFLSTMQDALQKVPDKKTADTATSHTLSVSKEEFWVCVILLRLAGEYLVVV
ncbi:MAG: hypothetical protein M1338_00555, partial [Patescibacteria group bacterium]|nr:hypothetical protein [Patescibacteria group bacterium]